jgi:hypothetical protein
MCFPLGMQREDLKFRERHLSCCEPVCRSAEPGPLFRPETLEQDLIWAHVEQCNQMLQGRTCARTDQQPRSENGTLVALRNKSHSRLYA